MSTPLVSVIMAAYNYERFIGRAIESALGQTYGREHIELIVVDDGSTDGTADVMRGFGDAVRAVHKPNGGLLSTVNTGLAMATGDYVTLLSADDTFPPARVALLAGLLSARPDLGLVYGDMEIVDDEDRPIEPSFFASVNIVPRRGGYGGATLGAMLRNNIVSGGALMMRRELAGLVHPIPPEAPAEDWWIATRAAAHGAIDWVPDSVYRYRWHGGNDSLYAAGERQLRFARRELPFRRLLVREQCTGQVPADDLVTAMGAVLSLAQVLRAAGDDVDALMPDAAEDAARADEERRAHEAAGDHVAALFAAARAAAAAPGDPTLVAQVPGAGDDLARARRMCGIQTGEVVACRVDELLAQPEAIEAMATEFSAADDVSFLVLPPREGDALVAAQAFVAAAGRAGLDRPGGPDAVLVTDAAEAARLRGLATVEWTTADGPGAGGRRRLPLGHPGRLRARVTGPGGASDGAAVPAVRAA